MKSIYDELVLRPGTFKTQCGFAFVSTSFNQENKSVSGFVIFTLPDGNKHFHSLTWDQYGYPLDVMNNIGLKLVRR